MMKNNFESIHLSKIEVNVVNNTFWVAPNFFKLFSSKRSDFIVKKAKNIQEIFKNNNLSTGNYYFSFNKDEDFKLFNELQKLSCLENLKIDKNVITEINKNKFYIFNYSNDIKLKFTERSLYKIYKGNAFLINENYFENYVELLKLKGFDNKIWIFIWTGSKFEIE